MFTKIECGVCGGSFVSEDMPCIGYYRCGDCGHQIDSYDLSLDEGERETTNAHGVLGYITEEVSA